MATKCELESKRILEYLNSDEMTTLCGRKITWSIDKNEYCRGAYYIHVSLSNEDLGIPLGYAKKVFDFSIGYSSDISIATLSGRVDDGLIVFTCFKLSKYKNK